MASVGQGHHRCVTALQRAREEVVVGFIRGLMIFLSASFKVTKRSEKDWATPRLVCVCVLSYLALLIHLSLELIDL